MNSEYQTPPPPHPDPHIPPQMKILNMVYFLQRNSENVNVMPTGSGCSLCKTKSNGMLP